MSSTADNFTLAIVGLGIALDREITEPLIDIYRMALRGYPESEQVAAMVEASSTKVFFPKPVELIDIMKSRRSKSGITRELLGNLEFEFADGGEAGATSWILSQPSKLHHVLESRLSAMISDQNTAIEGQVLKLISEIGKPPDTPT